MLLNNTDFSVFDIELGVLNQIFGYSVKKHIYTLRKGCVPPFETFFSNSYWCPIFTFYSGNERGKEIQFAWTIKIRCTKSNRLRKSSLKNILHFMRPVVPCNFIRMLYAGIVFPVFVMLGGCGGLRNIQAEITASSDDLDGLFCVSGTISMPNR